MIKIKTNRQLNIILILLAFILAAMFTFLQKKDFINSNIEAEEIPAPTNNFIIYHQLKKGINKKIVHLKYPDIKDLNSIIVYSLDDAVESQYNFYAHDFQERQLYFADINKDGVEDIIFIYKRNDSLFCSIVDNNKKTFIAEGNFLLERPEKIIFGKDWDLTIRIGGIIFNDNNEPNLVFSVWAGYAILPRGIYSYNVIKKEIKKFEFGAAVTAILVKNSPNGAPEIFVACAASGNTWRLKPKPKYDDFNSWFFVLDQHLDTIRVYQFNGEFTGIDMKWDEDKNVFRRVYKSGEVQLLQKVGKKGEIEKSLNINHRNEYHIVSGSLGNNSIAFSGVDTILVFNSDLILKKTLVNKNFNYGELLFLNIDDDTEDEIFYSDRNKVMLLDDDGSVITSRKRRYTGNLSGLPATYAKIGKGRVKVAENSYNTSWEYEITNIERYYLIPLYFFSFFIGSLVMIFLMKYLLVKSSIIISYFLSSTNRSQDAIMIFGNKLNLVFANKSALRSFNSKYSFWLNKKNTLAETDKELLELIKETLNGNRWKSEILSVQKNDKYLKYKCTAIPLKAPWKLNIAVYVRLEDISNQIINERQKVLAHSVQKVAHEIKTPLASILLNLDSAEENINTGSENLLSDIKTARQEIYRIRNFINSFLKLSSIHLPSFQPIKAESLINNALLRFTAYMSRNIKIDLTGDLQENVLCDAFQIEEALQVFIENAIDAMNGVGKIIIHCRKEAVNNRHYLQFNVTDEGPGIDDKIINSLFDPYSTTKMHGSGMGLAIAKKILEDHNSKIEIKPNEGRGTIIVFKLIIVD